MFTVVFAFVRENVTNHISRSSFFTINEKKQWKLVLKKEALGKSFFFSFTLLFEIPEKLESTCIVFCPSAFCKCLLAFRSSQMKT